ncbi:TraR/DksA C4-type zinc finger protein [Nocardiopsis sp. HNM0947]|uniref:TraR/DksA C4-type zinc finger protein n=1 Tax=Nocardiopsis coralli TaxID=2772213 RepID=A0ABR9P380_9ACTN|nr:TraR/DksA C4-type zinc finger protein [Nocardiopsis coralli]MBE2998311.1 TraR/DksA C4-type zinc finger protein [Nocardiopsis coralli]
MEHEPDLPDPDAPERVRRARDDAARSAEELARQWEQVVEASEFTNNDDEHDPEGSTIAYEREQVRSMLGRVKRELEALDLAAERLREGTYWTCERCGGPIDPDRLAARPTARACIGCARRP